MWWHHHILIYSWLWLMHDKNSNISTKHVVKSYIRSITIRINIISHHTQSRCEHILTNYGYQHSQISIICGYISILKWCVKWCEIRWCVKWCEIRWCEIIIVQYQALIFSHYHFTPLFHRIILSTLCEHVQIYEKYCLHFVDKIVHI